MQPKAVGLIGVVQTKHLRKLLPHRAAPVVSPKSGTDAVLFVAQGSDLNASALELFDEGLGSGKAGKSLTFDGLAIVVDISYAKIMIA